MKFKWKKSNIPTMKEVERAVEKLLFYHSPLNYESGKYSNFDKPAFESLSRILVFINGSDEYFGDKLNPMDKLKLQRAFEDIK